MAQTNGPKVRTGIHPRGDRGIRKSIKEIVAEVEKGRLDPATVAWARETWARAGYPKDKVVLARAILDRLREERKYIDDPVDSEFVVSSACLLEGCDGLKFYGEDCDGLLIAFLSAVEAVGIEAAVVNHFYEGHHDSHVLAAIYDRPRPSEERAARWVRCDPSTSQPFGTVAQPARERMFLIPGGKMICESRGFCDDERLGQVGAVRENLRPTGDFVGVGAPADAPYGYCPVCGHAAISTCRCKRAHKRCPNGHEWFTRDDGEVELGGHGTVTMREAAQAYANDVRAGLADAVVDRNAEPTPTPAYAPPPPVVYFPGFVGDPEDNPKAEIVFGEVSQAFNRFMVDQIDNAFNEVFDEWMNLQRQREEMELVVYTLGEQLVQPAEEGKTNWTPQLEREYLSMRQIVPLYLTYMQEARDGARQFYWDEKLQTILVAGEVGETALVEKDGRIYAVDTSTIDTTGAPPVPSGQVGQVAEVAIIGGVVVVGLGLIAVCTYLQYLVLKKAVEAVAEVCEAVKVAAVTRYGEKRIAAGEDPAAVNADVKDILAKSGERLARKREQDNEAAKPLSDLMDTAKMGLYAFIAVGSLGAVAYGISQVAKLRGK